MMVTNQGTCICTCRLPSLPSFTKISSYMDMNQMQLHEMLKCYDEVFQDELGTIKKDQGRAQAEGKRYPQVSSPPYHALCIQRSRRTGA